MTGWIAARHYDGRSAAARAVWLILEDGGRTLVARPAAPDDTDGGNDPVAQRWPAAQQRWPERTRHGQRVIELADGGSLVCADAAAFDAWRATGGRPDSLVVRVQQSWRATLAAALLLAVVLVGGYLWGLPLLSRAIVAAVPPGVDQAIGDAVLGEIEQRWMKPSALASARQQQLRDAFAAAVARAHPAGGAPTWRLEFRASERLGANAVALPGGVIVITDPMVELLAGHDEVIVGVLAHELGHVRARHGLRALVQVGLVGAVAGVALGDFSSLLAGAPAILLQLAYSRDFEREADAEAAALLRAAGIHPAVMVLLFERLADQRQRHDAPPALLQIALASHPADDERMAFFRNAPP